MSDDGWAPDNPMEHYVQVYFDIQNMMDTNPKEMIVKENDAPERVHHQGEVCYIPLPESTDDEDVEHRRKFFTPSLQMQRNQFVKDMLHEFKVELGPLRTMAVMGCGELSLEKYLAPFFADIGTRRVLSIDFCKNSLAQGKQRLKSYLNHIGEGCLQEPTLLEQYYGNILDYDDRLKIVDCVCSTEVEYLRTKCRNLIYIEDNRDGTYLIIPNDMTVTSLLKLMTDL